MKKDNFQRKLKYFLFSIFLISFSVFSQVKKTDSIAILLQEYRKTKQTNLPEKAFLLAEKIKGDSLLKSTYINFGMRSYFNKDYVNLELSEKKLHQFYIKTKDTAALAKGHYYKALLFKKDFVVDSSFYYFNSSKNLSVQLKDSLEATRRLLSMAALQYNERDYLGSESTIIEGLRFVEPLNELFFTGLLYERLGNVLFITNRQKEARKIYHNFFELQKKAGNLNIKYEEARLNNHLAKTYEAEEDYEKAIEYFNKSLAIDSLQYKSTYRFEVALEGVSYGNFKLGKKQLALKGYLQALKSRENRNYARGLSFSHTLLGEFYMSENNRNKALFHTKEGLKIAKKINFTERILENLLRLSKLVKGEKGRQLLEEHFVLNDSIFRRERSLKNQFAKVRYETEKKDKENNHLKEENARKQLELETEKQHKIIGWLLAGVSVLFICFGINIVSNRKKKMLFNAKLKQVEVREKERQQIAKSLHDEVAGDIRMLHLKLAKTNQLDEAKSLDIINENVRNLSHQLSSESFDKVSFKNQIINLVSDYFEIDFKIKVKEIDSVLWESVNNSIKRTLFLSIRESIQNTKKHANAKEVTINFSETKKVIILTISDNGKGFNINAKKNGIGLKNLKERVEEISGVFTIESELEKGTKTIIEIPKNG